MFVGRFDLIQSVLQFPALMRAHDLTMKPAMFDIKCQTHSITGQPYPSVNTVKAHYGIRNIYSEYKIVKYYKCLCINKWSFF